MRQPIDVSLHVINVLAGGEIINTDKINKIEFQQQNRANKMEGNLWVVDKISTCQQNHLVRVLLSQVLGIV
jgi:hypothetical protein